MTLMVGLQHLGEVADSTSGGGGRRIGQGSLCAPNWVRALIHSVSGHVEDPPHNAFTDWHGKSTAAVRDLEAALRPPSQTWRLPGPTRRPGAVALRA